MESVADLLFALRLKGARVWTADGQLHYAAPRGALASSDIETLRRRKTEIVEFLARGAQAVPRDALLGPRQPSEPVPLTLLQSRGFNRIMADDGRTNLRPALMIRLAGPLDHAALARALGELARRHEALRIRIAVKDGAGTQEIAESFVAHLERIDLADGSLAARETKANLLVRQLIGTRVDLVEGPLFRAWLLVLSESDHVLLLAMEHMLFDLPSMEIIHRDLAALYAQAAHRVPASLPAIAVQFPDYAVWQAKRPSSLIDAQDAYWQSHLAGATHLRVFADETPSSDEPKAARLRFRFEHSLTSALRTFCLEQRTTLMMALLTAYVATLSRWCQTTDLLLLVPATGRRYQELQNTVGNFGTVLYLRIRVRENETFSGLLQQVVETFDRAYEHDDSGKTMSRTPAAPFASNPVFNFNLNPAPGAAWGPLEATHFPVSLAFPDDVVRALQEPTLFLVDSPDGITGSIGYRSDRVRVTTVKRLEQAFQLFVASMVRDLRVCIPQITEPQPAPLPARARAQTRSQSG